MRAADTARRKAESRAEETPEECEGRLRQDASRHKARRAAEETDVAQARLRQAALRNANARAAEAPGETAARRRGDAHRHTTARAAEAPGETAARRRGDADRHTTARAAEAPEETAARLLLQASRQADARAAEAPEETAARLQLQASRQADARAAEAPDVAETRRRDQTARQRAARLAESFETRNVRLHTDNVRHLRSRVVDSIAPQPAPRGRARADPVEPQGPCELFEDAMKRLHWFVCDQCGRRSLEFTPRRSCGRMCKKFTAENMMDPGEVPDALRALTFVEQQLIARVHPVVCVYKIRGHQMGYSGNVISFPQNVNELARSLPHRVQDLTSVVAVRMRDSSGHVDFRVRSGVVRAALVWLRENNPHYANIDLNEDNLALLPEDGDAFSEHHHQEEQVSAVLDWPSGGSAPVDEFNTPGYVAMAFPTLFPTGAADLSIDRQYRVTPRQYFKHLLEYKDGRFANDPRFRFFAFNTVTRHEALRAGSLFVRRNEALQGRTVGELREMVAARPALTREIMFYGAKLHGTRQYWGARLSELLDMVNELGLPTLFVTLSAADLHWPDLFRLILEQQHVPLSDEERVSLDELTEEQRRNFIADQPFVPSMFFIKRAEYFLLKIFKLMYPLKDFWWRFEWQFRGSPHVHALLYLEGAPDVTRLKEMTPEEFADVVAYFDRIVSAWNCGLGLPNSAVHPCRKRTSDVAPEDRERHLGEILNRVQRHTRCSEGYCLRRKRPGQPLECRFKFPFPLSDETQIVFDDKGEPQFVPRRNDPLLNGHIIPAILAWIGNMDGKPILSKQAFANYLAKYAAKGEKKSMGMQELFQDAMKDLRDDESARKAIQRRCVQSISERDYSSQEILHLATSQKLWHCSRQFVKVNFYANDWVLCGRPTGDADSQDEVDDPDDGPLAEEGGEQGETGGESNSDQGAHRGSVLERYPKRPRLLEEVTLWSFARDYRYNRATKR
ncbi:hypothetical protein FOCC_FOCC001269 [Frankliniella occidentalis]|nr:hypothetical protein FOCC_FOCC001269 [Frankliniella occidentalis]